MDRPTYRMDADARTKSNYLSDFDAFLPPSRQQILDQCEMSLPVGPILLTGDAGIGKTWLLKRLIRQDHSVRWVTVELTPSDGPKEFYRHLARGLGMKTTACSGPSRLEIADLLSDRSADGERYALAVDEAQNLSEAVWEEIRVLLNHFDVEDGFARCLLLGQTGLVRQFASRSLSAIEARLSAHIHLRPIDIAETRIWLSFHHPELALLDLEVETIHRDSGGNPSRLSRRAASLAARARSRAKVATPEPSIELPKFTSETELDDSPPKAMIPDRSLVHPPLTGPDRPPLHVEENSIEVGWSADDEDSSDLNQAEIQDESEAGLQIHSRVEASDQAVNDHYAALQAWREWTQNQEKQIKPAKSDRDLADEIDEAAAVEATDHAEIAARDSHSIRSEGHQHFAPFGQLFNRMAPVREV